MLLKGSKEYLFKEAPVKKAVLSLAVPTVFSQLITVVYNMADTFFIGRLNDPAQVAAAALALPCFLLLTSFANLFGLGGSSLISRSLGAGDRKKARGTAAFCIYTCAAVSLLFGLLVFALQSVLFPILGATEETYEYLRQYIFWTVVVGALPTVMSAAFAHLIRAEGYSKAVSFGIAFGGVLNIVLDPIFIFVFKMNIEGAAVATMLSNVAAMLFFICFILSIGKTSAITLDIREYSVKDKIPSEVISVGLPGFIMTTMSTVSNTVLNHTVASYSETAIAGMGIAKKIDLLAFAIAQGMTQGTLPLIGYNYTSGNNKRMRSVIKTAVLYSLAVALCGTALLFFGAEPVSRFFIADEETVSYARYFLKIICLACPTTSLNFMIITVFQAVGKKTQPFVLSFLRKGSIDVVLMLLLNSIIGLSGIAYATPLADFTAFVISTLTALPYLIKKPGSAKEAVK